MLQKQTTLLLVEDDYGHARLLQLKLLRESEFFNIIHVDNGQDALDYLHGLGKFNGRKLPDDLVILLDLNMPIMSGFQVLEELNHDPFLKTIPRIIMTTSDEPDDINQCEQYGYQGYVVKPPDYKEVALMIETVL